MISSSFWCKLDVVVVSLCMRAIASNRQLALSLIIINDVEHKWLHREHNIKCNRFDLIFNDRPFCLSCLIFNYGDETKNIRIMRIMYSFILLKRRRHTHTHTSFHFVKCFCVTQHLTNAPNWLPIQFNNRIKIHQCLLYWFEKKKKTLPRHQSLWVDSFRLK